MVKPSRIKMRSSFYPLNCVENHKASTEMAPRPKNLTYAETVRFHGHNGPFLALGYRLGRYLVEKLQPVGIMDLRITVEARLEKPYTCIVDGLQCAACTTIGKGNIVVKKGHRKGITIFVEKGSTGYRVEISKEAVNLCLSAKHLAQAANKIFKLSVNKLWRII